MKKLPVITISRQYGSGGRYIGKMLAEALDIPYYDTELINIAAEQSGFDKKIFEDADKAASSSLLFSLSMYGGQLGNYHMPLSDRVYLIQSDIVRKIAAEGPCVIVGRCADYVLHDVENCMSVFLRAPKEAKIRRCVKYYGQTEAEAEENINRIDKRRSVYYSHFTGCKWGASDTYDIVLNTDLLGVEGCVEILKRAAEKSVEDIED